MVWTCGEVLVLVLGIPVDGTKILNKLHTDCAFFYMPSQSRHGTHLLLAYRRKANSQVLAKARKSD